jgi:hypothetical protein
VLVLDEQTAYDPSNRDDRMLLELKGTMSETELHWLRLRLDGGRRHKARRGQLWLRPPTGYVWNDGRLALDPDEAVQHAVRAVFARFVVEPSAYAVVRWANDEGIRFPTRRQGHDADEVIWRPLTAHRVCELLHNPLYTGTYVYGRRPTKKVIIDGRIRDRRLVRTEPHEWWAKLDDQHPAYIDWETYVANRKKLRDNISLTKASSGAPREGSALLTGLLLCGRCGRRMRTDYETSSHRRWQYVCEGEHRRAQSICWSVPGPRLDEAVTNTFLERMVPAELDVSLAVESELGREADALGNQWKARIDRAQYEARHAERRYKAVDPDNRVVARTLEREWDEKLREVEAVEREYADARRARRLEITHDDRGRIRDLARDLPALWRAATTPSSDRRAMLRTVMEVIALSPLDLPRRETLLRIQWKSGHVTELHVPRPARASTSKRALERVRSLVAEGLADDQIAERLDREGITTATGKSWSANIVQNARERLGLKRAARKTTSRVLPHRHPKTGFYSIPGAMKLLGASRSMVRSLIERGLVRSHRAPYNSYMAVWLELDGHVVKRLRSVM